MQTLRHLAMGRSRAIKSGKPASREGRIDPIGTVFFPSDPILPGIHLAAAAGLVGAGAA